METTGNSWCHCHCDRCNSQTKFHASWVYTHRKLGCACMADFPPNPLLKQQFKDGWISIVSKFFILILSWNWQGINTHLNDGIKAVDSKDLVSQLIRHWWGVIKIFLHLGNVIKNTRKGGAILIYTLDHENVFLYPPDYLWSGDKQSLRG